MTVHVANSLPYPWPYDGDLSGARTALVVIVAGLGPACGDAVAGRIEALSSRVLEAGGSVIRVATSSRVGVRAATVRGSLAVQPDAVMEAHGIDGFYESPLELVLRSQGYDRLLLVGSGLETSVHSTMRSANDRGFECLLIADACEAVDQRLARSALSMIHMSGGIFGATAATDDVLRALDRTTHERVVLEGASS